jgi:predicted negative regulator of RcsB-dependent stress response
LRELAHLHAARAVIAARTSRDAGAIDAAMQQTRDALAETGAPRIAAEVLLELGRRLPATSTDPDPIALLDEAASLFASMPIPMQQARCIEAAGDVLASRGDRDAADARYAEAEALLTRRGLGLGLAELARKRGHGPRSSHAGPLTASGSEPPRT